MSVKLVLRAFVVIAAMVAPYWLSVYDANERGAYDFGSRFHVVWIPIYGSLFLLSAFVLGIPTLAEKFRQAVFGSMLAAVTPLATASIFFVIYDPQIPRFVVVATAAVLAVAFTLASCVNVIWLRRNHDNDAVIAVLDVAESDALDAQSTTSRERKFVLVDTVRPNDVALGGSGTLAQLVTDRSANLIVLSEAAQRNESVVAQAAALHETGVRVRGLGSFYDEWLGKLPVAELQRTGMWFDIRDLHERFYQRLKRLMDIGIAVLVVPVFAIVVPVVWVLNRIANQGPLFFSQQRVGHQGSVFRIHKFRTMLPDSQQPDGGGEWTSVDDPRITKVGGFLRRSHLDELPQLINVLLGDLSIVGPRPEQPRYVEELTEKIPFYGLRHAVRPGMTGWAQVKYPYGASVEDSLEKLQYDLYYLRHQSLALDVRVIVRTFSSILFGQGR